MADEKITKNRPGRKALFTGAAIPKEAQSLSADEKVSLFISKTTEILRDYTSGNQGARLDEDQKDEKMSCLAIEINKLLEDYESNLEKINSSDIISDNQKIIISDDSLNLKDSEELLKELKYTRKMAEEYKEAVFEKEKLIEEYLKIIEDNKKTIEILNPDLEKYKTENEKLNSIIQQNETEIIDLNKEISDLKEEIVVFKESENNSETSKYEEEIKSLNDEIITLKESNQRLSKNIDESNDEFEKLRQNHEEEIKTTFEKAYLDAETKVSEKIKLFEAETEKLNLLILKKDENISKIESELNSKNKILNDYKLKISEYENILQKEKTAISEKDKVIAELKDEIQKVITDTKTDSEEKEKRLKVIETLKKRSETIVQQNPMPIILVNSSYNIIVANKAYEDMAGISVNDAKRMNLRDFEILEKSGDGISKVLKTGKRSLSELKIKLPAGIRFLKQYGIPIRKNGQVSEILIVYVDITHEMNKAEEIKSQMKEIDVLKKRSETIVQQNPMPIILLSKNLDILVSNNSFEKISGIERHALLKMNLKDFIFEDKKGDDISTVFSSKKRSYGEVSFKTPLGTHVLEQYAIPIMDERENISTVLVVYNEITRLRKNEKDLQELIEKVQKEAVCLEESAKEITSGMLELADKNLNIRSKISDNDPLKILKENFNNSVLSIKELIRDIASKTDNIEETADGLFKNNESISDAAQKMAQNAYESFDFTEDLTKHFEKISNGISDLSASIEEISSTTQDVMQKTLYAEKEGREAAAIGKEAFDKMEAVGEISKKSVQEINSLNYEIEKINDIVKLINGIAEQTNMLALNAAIEAARAGENGRGFAVVAGEVKNLAGESKKATLQIQELITSIQKNSQNTTDSMHHVDEEIKVGIKSTNAAIEALNKIVEEIVVASGSMTEISKATDIQAQETNVFMQLVDAANEINRENKKRTENITALAEEISSTTDEVGEISNSMHEMSIELKDAMKKFRIE